MQEPTSPTRVAVIQFAPQVGVFNRAENLRQSLELANEAVNGGANLIVLPELSNCGYFFCSRKDAFDHAEAIPDGPSVRAWIDFACRHQVYLVAGLSEIEGVQLFNTAVLLGPDGFIGKYRKAHLWNLEKLWFTPGDTGFPVFETPIGRIGLLICWDIWFPEVPRILSQQGADIICSLNS
ncbi:Carbon-nitrogen hydrolase [Pseudomonas sp. PDC86]|nr:Carbon-nitrogen hydrolase [Pseudomonas sp. PDC86]